MRSAVVLVALAGCAGSMPKQPKPDASRTTAALAGKTFGVPGESMEYQVDLRGFAVGRVQVAVGQPGWVEGERAIIIRSNGAAAGMVAAIGDLRWELMPTLALDDGEVINETEEIWLKFAGESKHERDARARPSRHNVHSAAGALRAWRSQVGDRAELDVNIADLSIDVALEDVSRELLGTRPAVRYDGIAREKYPFSLWLSDDEARVPLLLRTESKWGSIVIELLHYELTTP